MTTVVRCLAGAAFAAALLIGGGTLAANWLSPASAAIDQAVQSEADASPENKCVADSGRFKAADKRAYFIVSLENKCEQPVKCVVNANVRTARGNTKGRITLVLAAKSAGAEARKSFSLRVKVAGGKAQIARDCMAF